MARFQRVVADGGRLVRRVEPGPPHDGRGARRRDQRLDDAVADAHEAEEVAVVGGRDEQRRRQVALRRRRELADGAEERGGEVRGAGRRGDGAHGPARDADALEPDGAARAAPRVGAEPERAERVVDPAQRRLDRGAVARARRVVHVVCRLPAARRQRDARGRRRRPAARGGRAAERVRVRRDDARDGGDDGRVLDAGEPERRRRRVVAARDGLEHDSGDLVVLGHARLEAARAGGRRRALVSQRVLLPQRQPRARRQRRPGARDAGQQRDGGEHHAPRYLK